MDCYISHKYITYWNTICTHFVRFHSGTCLFCGNWRIIGICPRVFGGSVSISRAYFEYQYLADADEWQEEEEHSKIDGYRTGGAPGPHGEDDQEHQEEKHCNTAEDQQQGHLKSISVLRQSTNLMEEICAGCIPWTIYASFQNHSKMLWRIPLFSEFCSL